MSSTRPVVATWVLNRRKITDFLLAPNHPDNKGRHKFFTAFGFAADEPEVLARALLQQARDARAVARQQGRVGEVRLVLDGLLTTPHGRAANVRTIWGFDGQATARFITVVPLPKSTAR